MKRVIERGGTVDLGQRDRLDRTLGFGRLTASGVGIIIGAGIYVLIGSATAEAGAAVWISFVIAGVLSGLTALSYMELASMFPEAGAEFDYTRRAFPAPVAFVVGWLMAFGMVVASAAVALGFADYLGGLVDIGRRPAAFGLLGFVLLVGYTGIRHSTWLIVALAAAQVGGLGIVIAVGAPHVGDVDLLASRGGGGILRAASLAFFAFIGFDEVITLAEETKNPTRTVPRALFAALAISTALYVAVAIAAVSVLGPEALGSSSRPLVDVIRHVAGHDAATVGTWLGLIATTNTTLLALTAASRICFGMAEASALPKFLRTVNRRRAPFAALATVVPIAGAFVLVGDLQLVASVTNMAIYLVFLAVNATVVLLRIRRPAALRPYRVPFNWGPVPLPAVAGSAAVLLLVPSLDARAIAAGVGISALGLLIWKLLGSRPSTSA